MTGPFSPWDQRDAYDPLDVLDEMEWLSIAEQEAREEAENGDE